MGKPSGLAALEWDGKRLQLQQLQRLDTHEAVLAALPAGTSSWIAIDAPVLIRNSSGTRQADRTAHELFSRQHAGCYPVHLGLPFAPGILRFIDAVQALGYSTELPSGRMSSNSHVFEVFPHAASIRLFELPQILPYKKGKLATRLAALTQYRSLLASALKARRPGFHSDSLPLPGSTGAQLKACEDQLDALLCAYVAAHFWYWGLARTNILGHPPDGFIVNPSF